LITEKGPMSRDSGNADWRNNDGIESNSAGQGEATQNGYYGGLLGAKSEKESQPSWAGIRTILVRNRATNITKGGGRSAAGRVTIQLTGWGASPKAPGTY